MIFAFLFKGAFVFSQFPVKQLDSLISVYSTESLLKGHIIVEDKGDIIYDNLFNDESKRYQITNGNNFLVAIAIYSLQDKKILNVNDKVIKYIPNLVDSRKINYEDVTIKHLLSHTSGIKFKIKSFSFDYLKFLRKAKPYFKPGEDFKYSEVNFMLLKKLIHTVSGVEYPQYIKQLLLGNNTTNTIVNSKGTYSVLSDLIRLTHLINSNEILTFESNETMSLSPRLNGEVMKEYTYGWKKMLTRSKVTGDENTWLYSKFNNKTTISTYLRNVTEDITILFVVDKYRSVSYYFMILNIIFNHYFEQGEINN